MLSFFDSLRINERVTTILSYLIVWLMIVCFVLSLVQFVDALLIEWEGAYLVFLGALVALEAFYTQRTRKRLFILDPEWVVFYLAEFLVFILALKLFQLFSHGSAGILAQIIAMRQNFVGGFFNNEYLINLFLILIVWFVSVSFATPVDILRVDQRALRIEEEVGISAERAVARHRLADQVLFLGVIMVFLTSLLHFEPASGWFEEATTRLGVINVILYFVLGLVLLSLTQFTVLQMRWSLNHVSISRELSARWAGYSLLFLAILGGIALLLPTRYTEGILLILAWLVSLILTLFAFISWLVTILVFTLAALFASLFGVSPPPMEAPPLAMPTPVPPPQVESIIRIPAYLVAILTTIIVLAVVAYLLVYYYRGRRQDVAQLRRFPLLAWLASAWRWLVAWWRGARRQVVQMVGEGIGRLRPARRIPSPPSPWGYTSLRRMTPRQRIIFYYQGVLRRGEQSQVPRHPSQTPYEYAARLSPALQVTPEQVEQDLQLITEQFVEARYSQHEISSEQVSRVRQSWEHLKRALRHLRKSVASKHHGG